MSRICICVINLPKDKFSCIEHNIKRKFDSVGLYYENTIEYMEPFLSSINQHEYSFFSISNSYSDNSCEMFFLPDNWLFNGRRNDVPFIARMKQLENIFSYILKYVSVLELYIGDTGTELIDFETIEIEVSKFTDSINANLNSCDSDLPDVRYILSKTD